MLDLQNPKKNEENLNVLRKYPFEIAIVCLSVCVSYLFFGQAKLNDKYNNYLLTQAANQSAVIERNTKIMEEVKDYLFIRAKQARAEQLSKEKD